LNKDSGISSLCDAENFPEVEKLIEEVNENALMAYQQFIHRIVLSLGSYYALLDGNVDAIVFSGGIGYNSERVRQDVLKACNRILSSGKSRMNNGIIHTCTVNVNEEEEMAMVFMQYYQGK
jgi:acetate kinase